ncbi:MAG TPA: nitroreductase family deazaflavin-dependent oxidoreductase [Solirubrobacteraceae bacterium]|nr:nitroreductase family deazaflavin-dependent oxidoreductase [Solirubrobacteraceae bacterium]
MPKPPPPGSPFWKAWEVLTRVNIGLFRATGGRVGGKMGRAPILLLHHTGAKSGKTRVSPLIYVPDGDQVVVVASKGGVDKHPAWFHNLRANPETEVELPREGRRRVRARVAEGPERERLWEKAVAIYKPYAEYQTYTERQIPVVVLERAG